MNSTECFELATKYEDDALFILATFDAGQGLGGQIIHVATTKLLASQMLRERGMRLRRREARDRVLRKEQEPK